MPPLLAFEHALLTAFTPHARHLRLLDRLNSLHRAELLRPVIADARPALKATQFVGLLRLAGQSIQILPKMHRSDLPPKDAARHASRNLLLLLSYAAGLLRQLTLGPHRAYQAFDEDLPVLKGKWRLADQLRRPDRAHLFAVTHDLLTADNPLKASFASSHLDATNSTLRRELMNSLEHRAPRLVSVNWAVSAKAENG
jgi:5-methylcytosine-specific restriction endonuclease McrBC regulatory subunit McrC